MTPPLPTREEKKETSYIAMTWERAILDAIKEARIRCLIIESIGIPKEAMGELLASISGQDFKGKSITEIYGIPVVASKHLQITTRIPLLKPLNL